MQITNAMSVDVEDYFQVSAFETHVGRQQWSEMPCRVESNMSRILQLFSDHNVHATFFVLGWMAERFPGMIRDVVEQGHEIASHGYSHIRVIHQTPEAFRQDISRTKVLLEDVSGEAVRGYRAASYSINSKNLWALQILEETGHVYSSSIYPVKHDLYGMPEAPRFAFETGINQLIEVPVTTARIGNRTVPCGGGGFFRFYPYAFSRWLLRRVNEQEHEAGVFYFHPWEIDPDQPRQQGLPMKTRFRHYLNLSRMHKRLDCLLSDFHWDRMDKVFLGRNLPQVDIMRFAA